MKNFNWKVPAIVLAIIVAIFWGATSYVKHDTNFNVVHFEEVKSTVGADGRAAVGSPEVYQVQISPALCWQLSKNGTGVWRTLGWVIIFIVGIFIFLAVNSVFGWKPGAYNAVVFGGLAVALACIIAAYSSALGSNYVEVSASQYNTIKGDKVALSQLFTEGKGFIK